MLRLDGSKKKAVLRTSEIGVIRSDWLRTLLILLIVVEIRRVMVQYAVDFIYKQHICITNTFKEVITKSINFIY